MNYYLYLLKVQIQLEDTSYKLGKISIYYIQKYCLPLLHRRIYENKNILLNILIKENIFMAENKLVYKKMSIDELVILAQKEDFKAIEELIKKFRKKFLQPFHT